MSLFGYVLVKKTYLAERELSHMKLYYMATHIPWFSGWKDLEVLWDHFLRGKSFGGVSKARYDYARMRGTDEYGKVQAQVTPTPHPDQDSGGV